MSVFKSQKKKVSGPAMTFMERKHLESQSKLVYGNTSAYKKLLTHPQYVGGTPQYLTVEQADEVMTQILIHRQEQIDASNKKTDAGAMQRAGQTDTTEEAGESAEVSGDQA